VPAEAAAAAVVELREGAHPGGVALREVAHADLPRGAQQPAVEPASTAGYNLDDVALLELQAALPEEFVILDILRREGARHMSEHRFVNGLCFRTHLLVQGPPPPQHADARNQHHDERGEEGREGSDDGFHRQLPRLQPGGSAGVHAVGLPQTTSVWLVLARPVVFCDRQPNQAYGPLVEGRVQLNLRSPPNLELVRVYLVHWQAGNAKHK